MSIRFICSRNVINKVLMLTIFDNEAYGGQMKMDWSLVVCPLSVFATVRFTTGCPRFGVQLHNKFCLIWRFVPLYFRPVQCCNNRSRFALLPASTKIENFHCSLGGTTVLVVVICFFSAFYSIFVLLFSFLIKRNPLLQSNNRNWVSFFVDRSIEAISLAMVFRLSDLFLYGIVYVCVLV